MKTPETVVGDVRRRLTNRWHEHVVGDTSAFPHAFPLGRPTTADLKSDYAAVHAQTVVWQDWARSNGIALDYERRQAKGGSTQSVPTHVHVESIDQAAAIVGEHWPERLQRARARCAVLVGRFPRVPDMGRVLRLVDGYSAVDFELLLTVAQWYRDDPARVSLGVTPRQVPLPGVHAKWLQNHRAGVLALTGLDDLGLLPAHPARIHFTYLDPEHRAAGGRVHDSATVGDSVTPAYAPQVVVISENKDTAIHFPALARGIAVEGVGKGGKTPAAFPWIRDAPVVVYWGDIDKDGYEILDGYRADFGRDIDSILMDPATYDEFEQFGTDHDQHGKPLMPDTPKLVETLHAGEREVYLRVLDVSHAGHRRIEQERIPLGRARDAVALICGPST
ncbi:Wadjet anti-phage system protein JetD domain-containing protein [Cellulosimicrobium cellulans]|uniref:Wadjet anti-phage system protein JetD domain-containing protein n=1 Tax=Cellulosimicrobium cellulans TaxID=1710 RepID=UPI0018831DF2|nr:Wadjet anti-phage system protein JetD domain-containing protein [Cellulosimicrobium cellulans]MBE9937651.1 hypothetical protein [Cellulosimicrobium cellulans]